MKSNRRLTAAVLALCVAFAQSAALAWACPIGSAPGDSPPPAEATVAAVSPPCHGFAVDDRAPVSGSESGSTPGNLCEVHCQTPTPPDDAGLVVPVLVALAWLPIPEPALARAPGRVDLPEEKGAAPPARTRYCRRLN
ncbi:MAG: hypothetical protein U1F51_15470 [Burkholderiales bacterium]